MLRDGEGYQLVKEVLKDSKPNDWKAINRRLKARMEEKSYNLAEVTSDYVFKLSG